MRTRQSAKSPRVQKERIVCAPWSRRFDQWEQRDVGSPLHRRRDRASSPPSPSSSQQYLDPPIAFYLVSSYGRSCSSTTTSTTPPTVNLLATIWKRLPLRGATVGNDVRAITQVRVVYLTLNTRGKEGREVRNSKGRENWRRRRTISLLCDSSRYFFLNGMNGVAEMRLWNDCAINYSCFRMRRRIIQPGIKQCQVCTHDDLCVQLRFIAACSY